MPDFPPVTCIVITYNRYTELHRTLSALRQNMHYSGAIRWLISDDCSPDGYKERLESSPLIQSMQAEIISTPQNGGWGRNANHALGQTDTEYILQIEDDYILNCPLNLDAATALMLSKPEIAMLRFRGTSGTHLIYHQLEADISRFCPDYREGLNIIGKMTYLLIDGGSPSLWIYSHGFHLKSRQFHNFYGLYPEGLRLGACEEAMAHTVKDAMHTPGAPAIAILPDYITMRLDHIGISYQGSEQDKGA